LVPAGYYLRETNHSDEPLLCIIVAVPFLEMAHRSEHFKSRSHYTAAWLIPMNVFAFPAESVISVNCKTKCSARFSVVFGSWFVRELQSDLTKFETNDEYSDGAVEFIK
jgi:hypothetical protein